MGVAIILTAALSGSPSLPRSAVLGLRLCRRRHGRFVIWKLVQLLLRLVPSVRRLSARPGTGAAVTVQGNPVVLAPPVPHLGVGVGVDGEVGEG